jgi:hypothetical protein
VHRPLPHNDDQLPLFYEPAAPEPPKPRRRPIEPDAARYQRFKPKRRTLCMDCIRDIHERGIAVAPLPQVASWRRVTGNGDVDLLCDKHRRVRSEAGR